MNINSVVLSKDSDVRLLATRIGADIGGINKLVTINKVNLVAAINEVKLTTDAIPTVYATKTDVTKYATKTELTKAITDLINGADADSDTLKELADKITAFAQTDVGLVSTKEVQSFTEPQKKQARDNIGAVSVTEIEGLVNPTADYVNDYLAANV